MKTKKVSKSTVLLLIDKAVKLENRLQVSPLETIKNTIYEDVYLNGKYIYIPIY